MPKTLKTPYEQMKTAMMVWESDNPRPLGAQALVEYTRARKKFLRNHGWSGRTDANCYDTQWAMEVEQGYQKQQEAVMGPIFREAGFDSLEDYLDHLDAELQAQNARGEL